MTYDEFVDYIDPPSGTSPTGLRSLYEYFLEDQRDLDKIKLIFDTYLVRFTEESFHSAKDAAIGRMAQITYSEFIKRGWPRMLDGGIVNNMDAVGQSREWFRKQQAEEIIDALCYPQMGMINYLLQRDIYGETGADNE